MGIAEAVWVRANYRGSRVGALLVLKGRIVSTGYNGTYQFPTSQRPYKWLSNEYLTDYEMASRR